MNTPLMDRIASRRGQGAGHERVAPAAVKEPPVPQWVRRAQERRLPAKENLS